MPSSPLLPMYPDERERLLSTLIQHLDGMVYRCRCDAHWTMEFVSSGCYALTGYPPEALLWNQRISYELLTHAEDRARVRQCVEQAARDGGRFDVEYRIVRADATVRWVWERGCVVCDAEGRPQLLEGLIQDISERKAAEQALRAAEQRFRDIYENALEGIFQTTPQGRYLSANPSLARIYGWPDPQQMLAELGNVSDDLYLDPSRRADFVRQIEAQGQVKDFEVQVRRRDGRVIWISENARAVRDPSGATLYYEGTVEDISERKAYEQHIAYQASHDALTGLPNRMLLRRRCQEAIAHGQPFALIYLDLDHFKDINDCYGHPCGDLLIQTIAARLQACSAPHQLVARLGGDEFVVLLENYPPYCDVSAHAHALVAAVARECVVDEHELLVTCSAGLSLYPEHGEDADSLLKHADAAMYEAKRAGRNAVRMYRSAMTAWSRQRMELLAQMRRAIQQGEFALHYQPKVALESGHVVGVEALVRWRDAHGRLVAPAEFIPLAEESGLIEPLGEWVLERACGDAGLLAAALGRALPVSVNVSPRQFRHTDLVGAVSRALARHTLAPQLLDLELTESCFADDAQRLVQVLHALTGLGVSLSIDDFGTGYSSMSYLRDLPVSRLKIDRSFIADIDAQPANQAIVRAILSLGINLGLSVVAEGVEQPDQQRFLHAHGCHEAQGYLFGRPMPLPALLTHLGVQAQPLAAGTAP